MSIDPRCKICRRGNVKLFLKGEKCFSQKCLMIRKPYVPGQKGKRPSRKAGSEYGRELKEKQKLRNWYNLRERQFSNYVKKALEARSRTENADTLLIKSLENRLDNVIFRLGFAPSRSAGKQMVSHGHFLINGKSINVPSYKVKKGDIISVKSRSVSKTIFQNVLPSLKKYKAPNWLKLDAEKITGQVIGEPDLVEAAPPADLLAIFEYYSR